MSGPTVLCNQELKCTQIGCVARQPEYGTTGMDYAEGRFKR